MCLAYCCRASNRIINGWDSLLTTNSHVVDHDRIVVRIVGLNVFKTNQEAVDVDVLPRYRDYKDTTIKKKIKKEKDTEISLQRILHSAGHSSSSSFINSLLDFKRCHRNKPKKQAEFWMRKSFSSATLQAEEKNDKHPSSYLDPFGNGVVLGIDVLGVQSVGFVASCGNHHWRRIERLGE